MSLRTVPNRWLLSQYDLSEMAQILKETFRRHRDEVGDDTEFTGKLGFISAAIDAANAMTLKRAGTVQMEDPSR